MEKTENCSCIFYTFQPKKSLAWEGHLWCRDICQISIFESSKSVGSRKHPIYLLPAVTACATHSGCPGSAREFWELPSTFAPWICHMPDQKVFLLCQMAGTHSPRSCPVALHRSQSRAQAAVPSPTEPEQLPTGKGTASQQPAPCSCHQPKPGIKPLCSHPPDPA